MAQGESMKTLWYLLLPGLFPACLSGSLVARAETSLDETFPGFVGWNISGDLSLRL